MKKMIDFVKGLAWKHPSPQPESNNGAVKMMENSIIKLDRPYPIVQYKCELWLQVGSLFVITGEKDGIDPKTGNECKIPDIKVYPILSNEDGQFGYDVCTKPLQNTTACCRENEKVPLISLMSYLVWYFRDKYGRMSNGLYKDIPGDCSVHYDIFLDVEKYGCEIIKMKVPDGKITIPLLYHETIDGDGFYMTADGVPLFFYFPDDGSNLEQIILEGIDVYSDYLDPKDVEWNFKIYNDVDGYQGILDLAYDEVKKKLAGGIDEYRRRKEEYYKQLQEKISNKAL